MDMTRSGQRAESQEDELARKGEAGVIKEDPDENDPVPVLDEQAEEEVEGHGRWRMWWLLSTEVVLGVGRVRD